MEPKLMSYITAKYSSKSDMMLSELEWQEVIGLSLIHISEPRDRNVSRMPSSA